MFKLDLTPLQQPTWHPVELGPDQSIEISLRPLTAPDLASDACQFIAEAQGKQPKGSADLARIFSVVTDWRGVIDQDDKPIPFSKQNLTVLLTKAPLAYLKLLNLVDDAFSARPSGNLPGPSVSGSTAAHSPTTEPSASGSSVATSEQPSDPPQ